MAIVDKNTQIIGELSRDEFASDEKSADPA